jgi:hypothetical protein
LLRRVTNASGSALLLVSATLAFVPVAAAGTPAPDPSPAVGPDPYRAPAAPQVVNTHSRSVAPAAVTHVPVHETPVVRVKTKTRAPVVVAPARPVPQLLRPRHSLVARVAAAVAPGPRVSRGVALAVACLVLLSGLLVAGAAREVTR